MTGETMTGRWRAALLGLTFACLLAGPSQAGGYPDHPIRFINGFAAGGPVDTVARIMAQALSDKLGEQFVVENRAGSGGNIATAAGIASPPDGYTVMFSGANNAISASLYKHLQFDFMRDTLPVGMFTEVPNLMVVANDMPVKTVQEFIDYCKANPGKVSFASSGNGTTVHMSAEFFKAMTKCDMLHVPYRGSALAMPDVISNKVQVIFDNLPTAAQQAKGGSVRALGVTSAKRWPSIPDIPAIAETVPGYEAAVFYGMSVPKGTPPDIIAALNKAINDSLKDPKLVARFADLGGVPTPMTPEDYGKHIAAETKKWRKVVEFAGVSVD